MSKEIIIDAEIVCSSWGEWVDKALHGKTDMLDNERESRRPNIHFTGVSSLKEIEDLALNGWEEGTTKVKMLTDGIFNHVSSMIERVEVSHDVEGHSIDVGRFVEGEPECWIKFENVIQEDSNGHRLVRLVLNGAVSAGVSKDIIIQKGAAVVALAELLEYSGFRVQIDLIFLIGSHIDNHILLSKTILKQYDQNLDINIITYALAHPSCARGLNFSIEEQFPKAIRTKYDISIYGGYGMPTDKVNDETLKGDIYIGSSHAENSAWKNKTACDAWIIEQLEKQGVHLKKEVYKS